MTLPAAILPRLACTLLLAITAASSSLLHAQAFQGLPAGGGFDPQRVLDARYGKASAAAESGSAPAAIEGALATLRIESTGATEDKRVPVSVGQVFAPGAVAGGAGLAGKLADGSRVPLQVDVKARHPDGSLRHAVVSAILPVPSKHPLALGLLPASGAAAQAGGAPALPEGVSATFTATLDGKPWVATLARAFAKGKPRSWLAGPVVQEWVAAIPLADAAGRPHPHLSARFALRWYPELRKARVDLTVENDWAFEPNPSNLTYDAELAVNGDTVFRQPELVHYHHARWRKLAWTGGAPAIHVRHDTAQLLASRALPNYDASVRIDDSALTAMHKAWSGPKTEPMGVGAALPAMPTTGGRPDIGLLPGWAVMYLLGMDPRARDITFGTADLAGSWSMHYRDRRTDLPVSLVDYPYLSTLGGPSVKFNPVAKRSEAFPDCVRPEACRTPNLHDTSHQPGFAYLPYLLTGDHYYLEELQFWAMYNVFASNPPYRFYGKGVLKWDQVRGQAWSLRTLAQAAYITPDKHPLKPHFLSLLDHNLDWYNTEYTNNPRAPEQGFLTFGYAIVYERGRGIAPWQDDFFTSAVGHAAELGFGKAKTLLAWKARFPARRMVGEGSCWVAASSYAWMVRDKPDGPFYPTIGEMVRASLPEQARDLPCASDAMMAALKRKPGEMLGYSSGTSASPANMQPALAYAADTLGDEGWKAWRQFMARSFKPNFGAGPQFAIVPRTK